MRQKVGYEFLKIHGIKRKREKNGAVLVIRPDAPLNINPGERDANELERVYQEGRKVALRKIEEIKTFLNVF